MNRQLEQMSSFFSFNFGLFLKQSYRMSSEDFEYNRKWEKLGKQSSNFLFVHVLQKKVSCSGLE